MDIVLSVAAHMSPDCIPKELLGSNQEEAIQRLCKMSLLRPVHAGFYSMHRLTQAAARQDCSSSAALETVRAALSGFDADHSDTWSWSQEILPHAEALLKNIGDNERERSVSLADIVGKCGLIYRSFLHDYRSALTKHEQALTMLWNVYGPDTKNTSITFTLNGLGTLYAALVDYNKAMAYCEESLAMYRHVYGHDAKNTSIAATLNNLGLLYDDLGDYNKAMAYYE
jgi:tetratricopeptide (TPR) repeat protein